MNKPPLGLMPKWLHDELYFDDTSSEARIKAINAAIKRFEAAGRAVPVEWIKEKRNIIFANKLAWNQ